ncbi:MAG TPA: HAD-IIIA family hydrolase [Flavobacteriales bacterium]|jgi:3-deoxy-D-manno-octulosonate 8-phosphate phosphatase (KDO 8-P phosphatase)
MEKNFKAKLKDIHTFIFDVDGVFTNNIIYLSANGEPLRTANVRDGYTVQLAVKMGLRIVILSGGKGEATRKRFEGLGVKDIYLGAGTKLEVFNQFIKENNIAPEDICYMGDDIPDYAVMQKVGLATCPADAVPEIKALAHYISPFNGGEGCVRDILEQALKMKGMWMTELGSSW